jgi:hypothetical protein
MENYRALVTDRPADKDSLISNVFWGRFQPRYRKVLRCAYRARRASSGENNFTIIFSVLMIYDSDWPGKGADLVCLTKTDHVSIKSLAASIIFHPMLHFLRFLRATGQKTRWKFIVFIVRKLFIYVEFINSLHAISNNLIKLADN